MTDKRIRTGKYRIRLNQEYRNKIAKRIELGLDQEHHYRERKIFTIKRTNKTLTR
jgi:hypothetical protein